MTPEGWTRAALGQIVAHLGRGTSPKYADKPTAFLAVNQKCVRNGRVTVEHARPHEPSAPVKPDSLLRPGDVCVNSTGTGTIGRVGLWEPREGTYFVDTHVTVVRPDAARVVPKFLCESLLAPWMQKEMEVTCFTGSTNQIELSKSAFAELALLLPPLGEQRKIAAILSSVDDAIEATQAVIDQLQVVKKAMMAELLTRGLPGRHTRFKMTEIGEIPEEWEVVRIDTLGPDTGACVRSGPFGSSMKTSDFRKTGTPVLTIQSLGEGTVLRGGLFYVDEAKTRELAEYSVRPNDLVFSRVADIGRCVAVGPAETGWLISPNLSRIRLDPRKADAAFLMYCLTAESPVRRQIRMLAGDAGRPVISSGTLKAVAIPLPTPAEQALILSAGRQLEHRLVAEKEALEGARALKSALMSVLLTGEVRVKPDEGAPA